MSDGSETLKPRRHEWLTFVLLLLAITLPGAGFVGALSTFNSEAEVEFFGEELEECLIVVLGQRARRKPANRPARQSGNRAATSQARHIGFTLRHCLRGHRHSNGLMAPIRC